MNAKGSNLAGSGKKRRKFPPYEDAMLNFLFCRSRSLYRSRAPFSTSQNLSGPQSYNPVQWSAQQWQHRFPNYQYQPQDPGFPPASAPSVVPYNQTFIPPGVQGSAQVFHGNIQPDGSTDLNAVIQKALGQEWTAEQDATILRMKDEGNVAWAKIGKAIGKTKKQVSTRYHELKKATIDSNNAEPSKASQGQEKKKEGKKEGKKEVNESKQGEKNRQEQASEEKDGVDWMRINLNIREDEDLSADEIQTLKQIVDSFKNNTWTTLGAKFWDLRGWRPSPAQIKMQLLGEASSDVADIDCEDGDFSEKDVKTLRSLMDTRRQSMWRHITDDFNIETGREMSLALMKRKLSTENGRDML